VASEHAAGRRVHPLDHEFGGGGADVVWYLAELLFAEPPRPDQAEYQCESCDVLLQAGTAVEAYDRAIAWGESYAARPPSVLHLLGVSHLSTVGEELGDGTEIAGRFFREPAVWDRLDELIPPRNQLVAIQWERGADTPVGELLSPDQVAQLRRVWGQPADGE
jgi:hypothetical protein